MNKLRVEEVNNIRLKRNQISPELIRYRSIDIARGVAIFCMIMGHVYLLFPANIPYNYTGSFAAPFFIIIAGTSYDLLISSRVKRSVENNVIYTEVVYRALMLIAIDTIALLIGSIVSPSIYNFSIYFGVFQVIAIGYILGSIIPNNLKFKTISILILIILMSIINIFFNNNYLLIDMSNTLFPMLIYFLFGRIMFNLLDKKYIKLFNLKYLLIIPTFLFSYITILYLHGYKIIGDLSIQRYELPMIIIISSIMYSIFSFLVRYVDILNNYFIILKPFERMGKIAFTLFYLNIIIILFLKFIISKTSINSLLTTKSIAMYIITVVILILVFSHIEKIWSNYQYKYGIEWIYRQGSQVLVNYTQEVITYLSNVYYKVSKL